MLVHKTSRVLGIAAGLLLAAMPGHAYKNLETVGLAVYTDTARDIYMAGLLMPEDSVLQNVQLAPAPRAMEYRIATRRISSRGFSGTLLLQAEFGSGERAPDAVIAAMAELRNSMQGSLSRGDRFVISLEEDDSTRFLLNDIELLSLDDAEVFDFLFAGWVGSSSSSLLRDRLLSGDIDPGLQARYNSLVPTDERMDEIAAWMVVEEEVVEEEVVEEEVVEQVAAAPLPAAAPVAQAAAVAPAVAAAAPAVESQPAPVADAPEPVTEETVAAVEQPAAEPAPETAASELADSVEVAELDDREYQRQLREFVSSIMSKVFGNVRYPRRAIKAEREGNVAMLATLDEDGQLLDVSLDVSSGYSPLDEAALKAVRRSAPFPELSAAAREEFRTEDGQNYIMTIPVKFQLFEK